MYFIVIYIHVILEHQKNIHIGTPKGHSYFNIHVIFLQNSSRKISRGSGVVKNSTKNRRKGTRGPASSNGRTLCPYGGDL